MPVDVASLTALSELAARARAAPRETGSGPPTPPHLPVLGATARRSAVLAAASVAAGLVCGLLVPTASAEPGPGPSGAGRATASNPASVLSATTEVRWASAPVRVGAGRPAGATTARASATAVPRPTAPAATPLPAAARGRSGWPLPAASGSGRRIVYAERQAHLWVVGADGVVLRDYPVTGRVGRPGPGTFRVYSKSPTSANPIARVRFDLMVRFAHGITGAPIGFHTIPRWYDGRPLQTDAELGTAIGRGGCVRQSQADAEWLYAWSKVGDRVVVVR